jgi:hypothetical protein
MDEITYVDFKQTKAIIESRTGLRTNFVQELAIKIFEDYKNPDKIDARIVSQYINNSI